MDELLPLTAQARRLWISSPLTFGRKARIARVRLNARHDYNAFVVTKDAAGRLTIATIDLGPQSDADRHVSHWLALLSDRSADPAMEGVEADWIGQHVWGAMAHQLHGARNILVVPDGVFNVMPWAALRGATSDRFLIEDGYNFVPELISNTWVKSPAGRTRSSGQEQWLSVT